MVINRKALFLTLIVFLFCISAVLWVIERPLWFKKTASARIAAIAVRDNVSPLEKRGSALFTIPYLEKYYSAFDYYEASYDWITPREFCPRAEKLLRTNDSLDVFILSHGNLFYQWFDHLDTTLRKKIRMVYNTGCNNDSQCVIYKNYSATCYVGHTGEKSLSPVFYFYFLRRLFTEKTIEKATGSANRRTNRVLSFIISNPDTVRGSLGNYHLLRSGKK
jgi:hypothetical protein